MRWMSPCAASLGTYTNTQYIAASISTPVSSGKTASAADLSSTIDAISDLFFDNIFKAEPADNQEEHIEGNQKIDPGQSLNDRAARNRGAARLNAGQKKRSCQRQHEQRQHDFTCPGAQRDGGKQRPDRREAEQ